jgi:hypothetical protein
MAERTTSFAKTVEGLHHEESALDRAKALSDQFVKAQEQNNEQQKPREAERPQDGTQKGEGEKSGSQMVRQDAPVLRPTPSGPMRQPDRTAAYSKLAKERHAEQKKIDAAEMARQFKARQQKAHSHDHDRER